MMENQLSDRQELVARLDGIMEEIERAADSSGRKREDVHLMAVTKTVEPERVNWAVEYGIHLLGENRAQELASKYDAYEKDGVDIHFIGHLQTNKVRQVIDKVSIIDSVDSLKLAQEISRLAQTRLARTMDIMLEVNIGEEASKSGVSYREAEALLEQVIQLPNLRVRGLMCIPPICEDKAELEGYFEKMRRLFVDIKSKNMDNTSMDFLSMGMSGDFPYAIRHGANIVRLGTAIFGRRDYGKKND